MRVGMAQGRIREALTKLRDGMVMTELRRRQVPSDVLIPFRIEAVNVAQGRKMTGAMLGGMIGFGLLIFLFNGAMYAAVDTTAGEKERRTLEILLASPAGRDDIVAAKVSTAVTSAVVTGTLSFLSYVAAFASMGSSSGDMAELAFPSDMTTIALMILAMVPVAILAAALAVAMATPARSTREAMSYLTPGLFLVMFLGATSFLPGMQQIAGVSAIPVANFASMVRSLMQGEWSWFQYGLTFGANAVYASLAVLFAVSKFRDERILLRS
jgi:sodium transport system permease protein